MQRNAACGYARYRRQSEPAGFARGGSDVSAVKTIANAAKRFGIVPLLLPLCVSPAVAEPLFSSAGVLTRVVLSDNLFLARVGKESGGLLQLMPNVTGGRTGNRARYRYFYGPSFLIYGGGYSELNRVFQVLQADATVDLIDEYLGLGVTARANQNLIDPAEQPVGFNALANSNAFAQTASLQVTPLIRFPILRGDYATVRFAPGINYSFTADSAGDTGQNASFGSQSSLAITSGEYFSKMPWSISAYSNLFNEDDNRGTSSVLGTVSYPFTPRWMIEGLVGYDDGDYESTSSTGGGRWRITPYWTPSANTSIGLGYGWRYYGTDYYANVRHSHKRTNFSLTYESVVSNARTALVNANVVDFADPFGQPIGDPVADQTLSGSISNPPLVTGVFVQTQMTALIAHRFGRSTGTFSVVRNNWDYQATDLEIGQTQGNLSINRAMSPRANGGVGARYWIYDQSNTDVNDFNQYETWLQLGYRINRNLGSSVRYIYTRRNSERISQNYDQNMLWLTFRWTM